MELVVAKVNLLKALALAKAMWDLSMEGIVPQAHDLELGTRREFRRDVTFQSVDAEVQVGEPAQEAKLRRQATTEAVVGQLEPCQPSEVGDARRYGARDALGFKVQRDDTPRGHHTAGDPVPVAELHGHVAP